MNAASGQAMPEASLQPFGFQAVCRLLAVTEAAALAQRGSIENEEQRLTLAIEAMHAALTASEVNGRIVAGKGFGQKLGKLFTGEHFQGAPGAPELDLALDPVEGTSGSGQGEANAIAVLAAVPAGAYLDTGPGFYMEKFVVPPRAKGAVRMDWPIQKRIAALAEALGKQIPDLTIAVLEKPRHRLLIAAIEETGARVRLSTAGDVALAVQAALPEGPIDALMGTGGIAEGLMAATAARAVGGDFFARLDPQLQSEARALKKAGFDTARWWCLDELVASEQLLFLATGIENGPWLRGVETGEGYFLTESFAAFAPQGERFVLRRVHPARG